MSYDTEDTIKQRQLAAWLDIMSQGEHTGNLEDQIKMQLEQAKALRTGNAPQMRDAGRVTVAPHPLELLGGLAQEYSGKNLQDTAAGGQKKVRALQQLQFSKYLRMMAQGQQGQQGQQDPVGPLPPQGSQMPEG